MALQDTLEDRPPLLAPGEQVQEVWWGQIAQRLPKGAHVGPLTGSRWSRASVTIDGDRSGSRAASPKDVERADAAAKPGGHRARIPSGRWRVRLGADVGWWRVAEAPCTLQ